MRYFLLLLSSLLLLAACAPGGFTRDFLHAPRPDPAGVIILYRPSEAQGLDAWLYLDNQWIGAVGPDQHVQISVSPGPHSFGMQSLQINVTIEPNSVHRFLLRYEGWTSNWRLFPLSEAEAAPWHARTRDISARELLPTERPDLAPTAASH